MRSSDKVFGKWLRAGVMFSIFALTLSWLGGTPSRDEANHGVAQTGWGTESLNVVRDGLSQISPIALANACGMGASSCFKCHNGTRAAAPGMDAAKSPWHVQHKTVNNSCVGCHKGNPRLMKEEMAHANMVKSPKQGADSCGNCHKSDLAKVEAKYK